MKSGSGILCWLIQSHFLAKGWFNLRMGHLSSNQLEIKSRGANNCYHACSINTQFVGHCYNILLQQPKFYATVESVSQVAVEPLVDTASWYLEHIQSFDSAQGPKCNTVKFISHIHVFGHVSRTDFKIKSYSTDELLPAPQLVLNLKPLSNSSTAYNSIYCSTEAMSITQLLLKRYDCLIIRIWTLNTDCLKWYK